MKYKLIILSVLFPFYTALFSQLLPIKGKIADENQKPSDYAEIYLLSQDSIHIVKTNFTEEDGTFLVAANKGKYIFQIKQMGDIVYSRKIDLFQNIDLGTIMIKSTKEIQGITIEGRKKLIERKTDRLIFNVENSVSASGGNALDALKLTPGISVQNEKISLIGKSSMRVMINGRMLELSNEDINNYLTSIPSDNIKSIEVITNPPAKYEAEGNSGLINIVLKTEKENEAWNLAVQESYRQASYPSNSGNISFNYNKNKIQITSGISYGIRKYSSTLTDELHYLSGLQKELGKGAYKNNYFLGNIGIDYQISPKVVLGGSYNYSHAHTNGDMTTHTDIAGNTSYDFIKTLSSNNNKNNLHQINIHNSNMLDSLGKKLTIDLNFLNYKKDNFNFFTGDYFLHNTSVDFTSGNNKADQKITNYSLLMDMEHPTHWLNINYGLKLSFSQTDNNTSLYDFSSEILQPNENDTFIYKENIQSLYISGEKKFSNQWNVKAGIRAENTQTKGKSISLQQTDTKNYIKIFPTAYISYSINNEHTLSLNYGRRIQRPRFNALNPFRSYLTPYTYSTGNPNLQPSYSHNIEFSYNYKGINSTLYYTKDENGYEQVVFTENGSLEQVSNYFNCFSSDIIGYKQSFIFNKIRWWESSNEIDVHYAEYKSTLPIITNQRNIGWMYYFSTDNTVYLDSQKNFAFNIRWWYNSKGADQIDEGSSYNSLSLAFKMFFMNKNLQITLKGEDILGSERAIWTSYTNNIKQVYAWYADWQYFQLSILYKIGNKKLKQEKREQGNEEEKERIN